MWKLGLFLLILSIPCGAAFGQRTACSVQNVEAPSGSPELPVAIDQLTFEPRVADSVSWLQVKNIGQRPIDAVFAVVELYESGRYMLSMVFYAGTPSVASSFHPAAQFSPMFIGIQDLTSSLLPAQNISLEADRPVVSAGCPDRARLGLLQVGFSQGDVFEYRASGWRNDESLERVEAWSLSGLPSRLISVWIRLSIDEAGKAHVKAIDAIETKLSDWVGDQIESKWTFIPATYDGIPVTSKMDLLFRFSPLENRKSLLEPPPRRDGGTFAVVDVLVGSGCKAYEMSFGGGPISAAQSARCRPGADNDRE